MTDNPRPVSRRSELEISQLPEVAALAASLTTLFKGLGIPQQQYAVRVSIDKGTVSRYLNGRRVATQDFVERLFTELERHLHTSVTEETRQRINNLRMDALRVTDPTAYELEKLRQEVGKSHRDIVRLGRQVEALELLLDRREAEVRETDRQLTELRNDWIADQNASEAKIVKFSDEGEKLKREQKNLRDEILSLRRQLAELAHLKQKAEVRCGQLERELLDAEVALAETLQALGESTFSLAPDEVLAEVRQADKEQRYHDVARVLTLSAVYFTPSEIQTLWDLLLVQRRQEIFARRLLDDAVRFRSVEFLADLMERFNEERNPQVHIWGEAISGAIAISKTPSDLQVLYGRCHREVDLYRILRRSLTEIAKDIEASGLVSILEFLHREDDTVIAVRMLHAFALEAAARSEDEVFGAISLCFKLGMRENARILSRRWLSLMDDVERSITLEAIRTNLDQDVGDFMLDSVASLWAKSRRV
ncbi:hypothetical protein [Streptomyces sp. B22F1]|uniref:hypothetical protein n=1 Tax=Streptomyces sp. B22F1 TaxID=3153566 RepID=UPI00325E2CC4